MELLLWLVIMLVVNAIFGGKNNKTGKKIPGNPDIPGRPGSVELPEMPEEAPRSHRVDEYELPEIYAEPDYIEPQYVEPQYAEPEPPPQPRPQVKVYGGLGDMLLDMQKLLGADEAVENTPRQQRTPRRNARRHRQTEAPAVQQELQFEAPAEPAVSHLAAAPAAQPLLITAENKDVAVADLAALRQNMQLSEVQAGLLWQEVLDKPVALRRRGR